MQLIHDANVIREGFHTYIKTYLSLTTKLRETEAKLEGYDKVIQATLKCDQKLKEELVGLQTSSKIAT